MAKEKTLSGSVVGGNLQRQQKGQRKTKRSIFDSRKRTEHSIMNWREGISGKINVAKLRLRLKQWLKAIFSVFLRRIRSEVRHVLDIKYQEYE